MGGRPNTRRAPALSSLAGKGGSRLLPKEGKTRPIWGTRARTRPKLEGCATGVPIFGRAKRRLVGKEQGRLAERQGWGAMRIQKGTVRQAERPEWAPGAPGGPMRAPNRKRRQYLDVAPLGPPVKSSQRSSIASGSPEIEKTRIRSAFGRRREWVAGELAWRLRPYKRRHLPRGNPCLFLGYEHAATPHRKRR